MLKRRTAIVTLIGALLLGTAGGRIYSTVSPESIKPIAAIEISAERGYEVYNKLTWQEAIEYVRTPGQPQDYLDDYFYYYAEPSSYIPGLLMSGKQKGETFRYNHTQRIGNCFDYTTSAAALLSDNGYPPLLLIMDGKEDHHAVFLYRTYNGFGALGNTPLSPVYPTVDSPTRAFHEEYSLDFDRYLIVNLDDNYQNREWIYGDMNLHIGLPDSGYIKVK